jgi:hypothetical protein
MEWGVKKANNLGFLSIQRQQILDLSYIKHTGSKWKEISIWMPLVRISRKNSLDCERNLGVLSTDDLCVDQSMEKPSNEPL